MADIWLGIPPYEKWSQIILIFNQIRKDPLKVACFIDRYKDHRFGDKYESAPWKLAPFYLTISDDFEVNKILIWSQIMIMFFAYYSTACATENTFLPLPFSGQLIEFRTCEPRAKSSSDHKKSRRSKNTPSNMQLFHLLLCYHLYQVNLV